MREPTASRIKPGRAALSLYVAVVLHLLVVLALALGSLLPQLPPGAGRGLGEAGEDESAASVESSQDSARRERQSSLSSIGLAPSPAAVREAQAATTQAEPAKGAAPRPIKGAAGGGRGGYLIDLRRHLSRHRRSLPGVLTGARSDVAFVLDAAGGVSDIRLDRSSGVPALDAEAVALIRRAAPLPPPPEGKTLRLVVPVMVERAD